MFKAVGIFACFAASLLGVGAFPADAAEPPVKVVATFTIVADMVREVGGDAVQVTTLVGPDGDAHEFTPRPSDARALRDAGVIVENGLGFEPWLNRLVANSGFSGTRIIAGSDVPPRQFDAAWGRGVDPHAWQNVANAKLYVAAIKAGLSAAIPKEASRFEANAARYTAELTALDEDVRAAIDTVPPAQRAVITSHDAFGYFGAAYGVHFLAPMGVGTENEPSAAQVAALIRQIRSEHIRALFFETMEDHRLVEQLARETGATVDTSLHSDALSAPGGSADTYIKMMRDNVAKLVTGMRLNAADAATSGR